LKSGTFGTSYNLTASEKKEKEEEAGLVLLGRRTAWEKSGTSREIQDRWQPYVGYI